MPCLIMHSIGVCWSSITLASCRHHIISTVLGDISKGVFRVHVRSLLIWTRVAEESTGTLVMSIQRCVQFTRDFYTLFVFSWFVMVSVLFSFTQLNFSRHFI